MSEKNNEEKKEEERKSSPNTPSTPRTASIVSTAINKDVLMKYWSLAVDNSPKQIQPHLKKATPFVGKAIDFAEKMIPILEKIYAKLMELWAKIEPHKPHLLAPAFMGFIMCFFGGSFLTLIAAVEAFNMCGYETTMHCVNTLIEDMHKVKEAFKHDDAKDDDGDGVPDVLQVSNSQLLARKTLLFLKVVDPNRVTEALAGISAGGMAVVAALKLRFAKTIALGNAIATTVQHPAEKYVLPHMEAVLPPDYKKWARPVLIYSIKSIAVSIAWTLQRILSAFHSAMRGGLFFSRNVLEYLGQMGYVQINHEETLLDEFVGYGLAILGLWFQLSFGFGLPFPLNIILFPFTLAEYILIALVNK